MTKESEVEKTARFTRHLLEGIVIFFIIVIIVAAVGAFLFIAPEKSVQSATRTLIIPMPIATPTLTPQPTLVPVPTTPIKLTFNYPQLNVTNVCVFEITIESIVINGTVNWSGNTTINPALIDSSATFNFVNVPNATLSITVNYSLTYYGVNEQLNYTQAFSP